jgi:hypothetical protein
MTKTVIMVWTPTYHQGLGDVLRGTIFLYQMSVKYGFKFIVDIQLHPISQHLIIRAHDHMEYVRENANEIQIIEQYPPECLFRKIYDASLNKSTPLLICTNACCNENISMECKQFMKTFLTPNDQFVKYIHQKNALHDVLAPYSILHIRLSDEFNETNDPEINADSISTMNYAMQIVRVHAEQNDTFMSNSFRLNQHLKSENVNIRTFNTNPMHFRSVSTFNEAESFKETLYEFFTLTKASKIKTHSMYGWVSGFVKFAGLIYDVPVIDLKKTKPRYQPRQVESIPITKQLRDRNPSLHNVMFGLRPLRIKR